MKEQIPLAAVLGNPITHSLSPDIFGWLAHHTGSSLSYFKMKLTASELEGFVTSFQDSPLFVGWNVTRPLKEKILSLVQELSPEAAFMGAVNVVHFERGRTREAGQKKIKTRG